MYVGKTRTRVNWTARLLAIVAALAVAAEFGFDAMRTISTARLQELADMPVSIRIEAPHFTLTVQWKD
jgi:hypothetical protein